MKIKEIDEMDWKKQIEKLEDELQKLTEKENRIAERKKEVGEKLRKVREQKENEENKQLADIVTEYLGPMDPKKNRRSKSCSGYVYVRSGGGKSDPKRRTGR